MKTPSYAHVEDAHLPATNHSVVAPLKVSVGLFAGQLILVSDVSTISNSKSLNDMFLNFAP